jgi:hypothetical protein
VSPCSLRKWIDGCDWHARPRFVDGPRELREFPRASHRVVFSNANLAAGTRQGLDSVRMGDPPALSYELQTSFKLIASGEGENRIDSVRRELSELFACLAAPRIDNAVGSESPDESGRLATGGCRHNACAATLRKLHGKSAYSSGCSENQYRFALPHAQCTIDPLQRRQASNSPGTRMEKVESPWHGRCPSCVNGNVLGVEAALRISSFVPVSTIADTKTSDAGALGYHNPGTVCPQHERELGTRARLPGAVTNRLVPTAHTGRMQRDEHLARPWLRDWQRVKSQDGRWSESIDGGRLHRFRKRSPSALSSDVRHR